MKHRLLPLAAAFACSTVIAQTATPPADIVVTATRLPGIAAPLPNTTVITREDIATRQTTTLADLLQQEAGLVVNTNGGPFTSTGLFLRGSAGKQVLLLVDGVRVNDASQGAFDLSLLRADDIERIEIARGPYSPQYGSDAIGGVVQVFTRRSARAEASVRAGRFNTQEYSVGARLGDADNGLGVRAGYIDSDGHNNTRPSSFAFAPDTDGGLARTAQLSGQTRVGEDTRASFSTNWRDSHTEFDQGLSEQEFGTASARLEQGLTDTWRHSLQLGWMRNQLDTDGRGDPWAPYFSRFQTERNTLSWLHQVEWTEGWNAVAGVDYEDERAESRDLLTGLSAIDSRLQNAGVFLTQHGQAGRYSGSASVRADDHDSFGRHSTGSLTLAAQLHPSTRLYAAYGSAFRAPSANDLYYPGDPSFCFPLTPGVSCYAGNPALQPEKSRSGEVGIEVRESSRRVRVSAYRNRVRNLVNTSAAFPYGLINEASATLQGIELDADGREGQLTWRVNAGSQSAEDERGQDLVRRPQGTFNGLLQLNATDALTLGAELRARSSAQDGGQRLGGYTLFNVFAGWEALPSLTLGARLENAGNKDYQEVLGYRTAPRSGYLTATYRWD